MKFSEKAASIVMVIIALCWVVITILGATENGGIGCYITVVLTASYGLLGLVHNGQISKKLLIWPLLLWIILIVTSIIGMNYYNALFHGIRPAFTILGFHPSYAFVVFFNWFGGIATWTLSFYFLREEWLSKETWDNFLAEINLIDDKEGKINE